MKIKTDKEKMEQDIKQIGINIKNFRKLYKNTSDTCSEDVIGLTQKELAEKLDVSINTISLMEQGKSWMSLPKILQLCKALDISLFDIFKDTSYVYTNVPKNIMDRYEQLNNRDKKTINALINHLYKIQKASEERQKSMSQYLN